MKYGVHDKATIREMGFPQSVDARMCVAAWQRGRGNSNIHENQKLVVIKLCGFHVQTIKFVLMVKASWILLPMLACCKFQCYPWFCATLCNAHAFMCAPYSTNLPNGSNGIWKLGIISPIKRKESGGERFGCRLPAVIFITFSFDFCFMFWLVDTLNLDRIRPGKNKEWTIGHLSHAPNESEEAAVENRVWLFANRYVEWFLNVGDSIPPRNCLRKVWMNEIWSSCIAIPHSVFTPMYAFGIQLSFYCKLHSCTLQPPRPLQMPVIALGWLGRHVYHHISELNITCTENQNPILRDIHYFR